MSNSETEKLPLPARRSLYVVAIVFATLAPFAHIMLGAEWSQALVVASGVLTAAAGVTALTHPTSKGKYGEY